ncbi:MAG: restriction endonuclease subunit R [Bermanella sp.]
MITEDQLEQLCLELFQTTGYDYICGYDIAQGESAAERSDYRQVILHDRLLSQLEVINRKRSFQDAILVSEGVKIIV